MENLLDCTFQALARISMYGQLWKNSYGLFNYSMNQIQFSFVSDSKKSKRQGEHPVVAIKCYIGQDITASSEPDGGFLFHKIKKHSATRSAPATPSRAYPCLHPLLAGHRVSSPALALAPVPAYLLAPS